MTDDTYLLFHEVKLSSTRVQHCVKVCKTCELASENIPNVFLELREYT